MEIEFLPDIHSMKDSRGIEIQKRLFDFFKDKIESYKKTKVPVTINIFAENALCGENLTQDFFEDPFYVYENFYKDATKQERQENDNFLLFKIKLVEFLITAGPEYESVYVNFVPVPNLKYNKMIINSFKKFANEYDNILKKYKISKRKFIGSYAECHTPKLIFNVRFMMKRYPNLFLPEVIETAKIKLTPQQELNLSIDLKQLLNKDIVTNTREYATIMSINEYFETFDNEDKFPVENYLVFGGAHNFEKWSTPEIKIERNKTINPYVEKEQDIITTERVRDSWLNRFGNRKIYTGKLGGRYYKRKGKKVYI